MIVVTKENLSNSIFKNKILSYRLLYLALNMDIEG